MAVVEHTPYKKNIDCKQTNEYIVDGHGRAVGRTNRYITNGHGLNTICEGFRCPSDPILATAYMEVLRQNYERQRFRRESRTKGNVTHEQIYVSFPEDEQVPLLERMEMVRKLINRTPLRDFASIYSPHDNTLDGHVHISICPFSIPEKGKKLHKLCMNNTLLYTLRREMDYICYEHGYSIIESRELWGDKKYYEWFQKVKGEGRIKIHPPKERDMSSWKKDRNRKRSYSASKKAQTDREKEQLEYIQQMTSRYTAENAPFFFAPHYLYDPQNPTHGFCMNRYTKEGKRQSDMELSAGALYLWAKYAAKELKQRGFPKTNGLQKRLLNLAEKAWDARELFQTLDIQTPEEMVSHLKEVGKDIAELKQDIQRQKTILERMSEAADEAENAKQRYARAKSRKEANEKLLKSRSAEYRRLKQAESTLRISGSEELWHEYLATAFSKEIEKNTGWMNMASLQRQLYSMGEAVGLSVSEVDQLVNNAKNTAQQTTWVEYRAFMQMTYIQEDFVSDIYKDIKGAYADIRRLKKMMASVPVYGPLSFVLALIVGATAGFQIAVKEREIEQMREAAVIQKEYSKETRREQQAALRDAKNLYDAEVRNASQEEIQAARIRFYETAAKIVGRLDISMEIAQRRKKGVLDDKFEKALVNNLHRAAGVWKDERVC